MEGEAGAAKLSAPARGRRKARGERVNCAAGSPRPRSAAMPMIPRLFPKVALAIALVLALPGLHAEALLKPVPTPDLSKLPPAKADELRKAREEFDKTRAALAGDRLAETYSLLAAIYARADFYAPAAVAIEDAVLLAPNDGRWRYLQGIILVGAGDPAGAKQAFENAFRLDQNYLPIRTAAATRKIEGGDLEGARRMLEEYTAKKQDQAVPYSMLGDIALKQKRYADAVDMYQRALKLAPEANKLYVGLAEAYGGSGNAKAAADARSKAGKVPPSMYDPLAGGLFAESAGNGAAAPPKPAAPSKPLDAKAQAMLDAYAQFEQRQYAEARASLDKVLRVDPRDVDALALAARTEAFSGNLPAAQSRAAAAVAAGPGNVYARLAQGIVHEMSGDDAAAQRSYEEAARLDPRLYGARLSLGNLLMRGNRPAEAIVQYRAAAESEPAQAEAWARLVAAEVAAGRCEAAVKDVNGALAKDANNGFLLQLFARLASTCGASSADEKRMALDYSAKLYRSTDSPQVGEAYALALAANGKWDDAAKTQQAAMFIVLREGGKNVLPAYREVLQQLQAKKLPDRPWPANADIYHPARLQPDRPAPAAQVPPKSP